MAGVGMRLMLRPGEAERIKVKHVKSGEGGTYVQLVARKADKVKRADPWHLIECTRGEFCPACGIMEMAEIVRRKGKGGEGVVLADCKGRGPKRGQVGGVANWILRKIGKLGEQQEDVLVGKSWRVGGAMAAVMGGASELVVRVTGSWKSDALLRYIGGLM